MSLVSGNVVRDKTTGKKRVIRKPETLDEAQYELVCENPHDDGDFSYLRGSVFCRCYA